MRLYRPENIELIMHAIEVDEYDDAAQDDAFGIEADVPPDVLAYIRHYIARRTRILEVGCGAGALFGILPITHAVEPSKARQRRAKAAGRRHGVKVRRGVAEALPFDGPFDAVIMLNGWFQLRSDYEALLEVNRCLHIGGLLIINLLTNDGIDIIQGRVLGADNYRRVAEQFGFTCVGMLEFNAGPRFEPQQQVTTVLALRKDMAFSVELLNQPQVDRKHVRNYYHPRDWRLV